MAQTLAQLKAKLIVVTDTSIGEVLFDWSQYLNEVRKKTYPIVLWSLNGMTFTKDVRSSTIQKVKVLTIKVFAINTFDVNTEDKITVWDTLETYFDVYINAMNDTDGIQIFNIDEIEGEYYPEGLLSVDSEVGISYEVTLKMFC